MKTYDSTKIMTQFLTSKEVKVAEILGIKYYPTRRVDHTGTWIPSEFFSKFDSLKECEARCKKHAPKVRQRIVEEMRWQYGVKAEDMSYEEGIDTVIKKRNDYVRRAAALLRNRKKIMHDNNISDAYDMFRTLNTGANIGGFDYRYGKQNKVICDEFSDYKNGYAKSCNFTMTRRNFTLEIKKGGWHVAIINKTITFYRTLNEGAKVEIVKQGRAISDIATVKAHIENGIPVED